MNIPAPDPAVAAAIAASGLRFRAIVDALRELLYTVEPGLEEAMKWNRITYTRNGNWHHWICGIGHGRAHVALSFHKGALLDDPAGLLRGSGAYLRQVYLTALTDIAPGPLADLLRQAVDKQTAMKAVDER
jgi:hypothetical protein